MRLAFEFVPPVPTSAIPNGSRSRALATCLHDFLVRARVTHGDLACKHLLWTPRFSTVHLMLIDFDMATFEHSDWNATARQEAILDRVRARLRVAQALLRQRKVAKAAPWFAETSPVAQRSERFVQFVGACAQRRRQGLDAPTLPRPCYAALQGTNTRACQTSGVPGARAGCADGRHADLDR